MNNLRLTSNKDEFFDEDGNLLNFLANVKDINLFIGANNTRKSRLMRSITQFENKILCVSNGNIDQILIEGQKLLEKLSIMADQEPETVLINFVQQRFEPEPSTRFAHAPVFFQTIPGPQVKYLTLKNFLENILETILKTSSEIGTALNDIVNQLHDITEMLEFLYQGVKADPLILYTEAYKKSGPKNITSIDFNIPDRANGGDIRDLDTKLETVSSIKVYAEKLIGISFKIELSSDIYIPVLRSSRNLLTSGKKLAGTEIFRTTINYQYYGDEISPSHITVHTGQEHYELIDNAKRGKTPQRRDFKEFEQFIGKSFYQSDNIEIIAYSGDGLPEIIVSLPDEMPDVPIYNLGDGVQAVINLFFPIFTAKEKSWIFIDEPELNLHPGFQNLFIRTLLENEFLRKKNLRYFINSHSNHILSEIILGGADRSEVFVFRRRDSTSTTILPFEGFENTALDLLGVMNTSTLISNCSIWVEGITDRLYLRAFLTAFLRDSKWEFLPIEGINYSFVNMAAKTWYITCLKIQSTEVVDLERSTLSSSAIKSSSCLIQILKKRFITMPCQRETAKIFITSIRYCQRLRTPCPVKY